MASNGCVHESVAVAIGTLTKWLMRVADSSIFLVCRSLLLRRQQTKDKNILLLADLIIDSVDK